MRTYDARKETPRNLFRMIKAFGASIEIEGITKPYPRMGDRLIAMNGLIFSFVKIEPAGGPPGSFRALLQHGGY